MVLSCVFSEKGKTPNNKKGQALKALQAAAANDDDDDDVSSKIQTTNHHESSIHFYIDIRSSGGLSYIFLHFWWLLLSFLAAGR